MVPPVSSFLPRKKLKVVTPMSMVSVFVPAISINTIDPTLLLGAGNHHHRHHRMRRFLLLASPA
jgi:hypothetical protein